MNYSQYILDFICTNTTHKSIDYACVVVGVMNIRSINIVLIQVKILTTMARSMPQTQFAYQVDFDCVIRGHHISMHFWTPLIGKEILPCRHDASAQAQQHDANSIGVYKNNAIVGHTAGGEMSKLLHQFLLTHAEARLVATPSGERKKEVGLVVSCTYRATLPRSAKSAKRNLEILKQELTKINNMAQENVEISVNDINMIYC